MLFRVITENGTAFYPNDFAYLDSTFSFPEGSVNGATVKVNIDILEDLFVENNETFYLKLVEADNALQVTSPSRSEVTINDNDGNLQFIIFNLEIQIAILICS